MQAACFTCPYLWISNLPGVVLSHPPGEGVDVLLFLENRRHKVLPAVLLHVIMPEPFDVLNVISHVMYSPNWCIWFQPPSGSGELKIKAKNGSIFFMWSSWCASDANWKIIHMAKPNHNPHIIYNPQHPCHHYYLRQKGFSILLGLFSQLWSSLGRGCSTESPQSLF